jgi:ABC-2 type transport system ATP-binding protein
VEVKQADGKLRFEHPRGHEFVPQLVEAFPGEIRSVTVARPSLDDVFFQRTGRSFWTERASANGQAELSNTTNGNIA